jgi:hypothetical protein
MIRRILIWTLLVAAFFVAIQFIPAYFYASEFEDFVKDEVKFAPTRESTDRDHLVEHIMEASNQYGVQVNPKDIFVKKTENTDSNYETLSVSVAYSIPVDLYYFTHQLHFQVNTSISY